MGRRQFISANLVTQHLHAPGLWQLRPSQHHLGVDGSRSQKSLSQLNLAPTERRVVCANLHGGITVVVDPVAGVWHPTT